MADQDSDTSSTATKSTAKKTASKKTSGGTRSKKSAPRAEPGRRMSGARIAEAAARQFAELSSREVEGVSGLQRTDDGWVVELDVLELRRVPDTTDVLATYEISVDTSGDLQGYRRTHRYVRGQADDGS